MPEAAVALDLRPVVRVRGEVGPFVARHIGPQADERAKMLDHLGFAELDDLVDAAMPRSIRMSEPLALPAPLSERETARRLRDLAARNRPLTAMIGLGYHGTITPAVIRRNVLEDPAWYTAYTPYQPEISQGRLEALLNFQTMVADLTGLPIAGASLLDEATAVAEAMTLARRSTKTGEVLLLDADTLPQTVSVVRTRARALGIEVVVADGPLSAALDDVDAYAVVVQTPGGSGRLASTAELANVADKAHGSGALVIAACDLLALTLVTPPGEWGADIAVGSSQRFGVPLFYGGPHAGFISVREGLQRGLPGRLVGVSRDADGAQAYRLALQTREQHIRREKATSNICTAQVLLAVTASMYAVYHGPAGLRSIAAGIHERATGLAGDLGAAGVEVVHDAFFDTVLARLPGRAEAVVAAARDGGAHLRLVDGDHVGVSVGEDADAEVLAAVRFAFGASPDPTGDRLGDLANSQRVSAYLTHPVFTTHHSETAMLRYLRALSDRDFALDRGMIPLGSCTMKLNATTEMEPISLPGFADLHPFAPAEDADGYRELIEVLQSWLAEVTGYDRVSIQPNAGSQGEFAGLLAIRAYHDSRGDNRRRICLIPSSAHGTNAASAVMSGMRVVVVKATADGSVDLDDLHAKIDAHAEELAAIMVTYPSTHGVFEESIVDVCAAVHEAGGQVYVDGANLNALLGLARPGKFGADVSHLNLHKTFCIPHGGGGPGVGPVAVREHLADFLPRHPLEVEASSEGEGRGRAGRHRADLGGAVRVGRHPADQLRLHRDDGRGRTDPGDRARPARGQLRRQAARRALPGAVRRPRRAGRPRVHPRSPPAHQGDRDHRRRRREAADRLRVPRADDELPGRGHADGRADRVGEPRGAGPLLRGDDLDQGRDRPGGGRGVAARTTTRWSTRPTPRLG